MSVCPPPSTAQQRGKDGCLWSEGRRQRRLDGEERAGSFALLLSMVERLVGALGLLDVLLSVGGQSFVAPFFTAPRGQCCVSSLDVAVGARWWAQAQVCGDAAVVVDGGCFKVMFLPPFSAPCTGALHRGGRQKSRTFFLAPQENGESRHLAQLWRGKGGVIDTCRRRCLPEIVHLRPWRQAAAWMDGILSAVEGFWSSREETKQGCQVGNSQDDIL